MKKQRKQDFTVGCIGAGHIASALHLPVLSSMPGVNISWISDIDQRASRTLAKVYRCRNVQVSHLENECQDVDIILIAIPYGARTPYYTLLEHKFQDSSLFIEKPLGLSAAEHSRIADLRPTHRVACNFFRRLKNEVVLMKELISNQLLGPLRKSHFEMGGVGGYSVGSKYYATPGLAGGGMLMEVGVHYIDSVLFCTEGRPIGELTGQVILDNSIDIHTQVEAQLLLPDQTCLPFTYEVTLLEQTQNTIEFTFDKHVVSFSLFNDNGIQIRSINGDKCYTLTQGLPAFTNYQMAAKFWLRYFAALNTGVPNETTAASSLDVTRLIEATYNLTNAKRAPVPLAPSIRNVPKSSEGAAP